MAQVAVWIAAAACAFCLSALGSVAGVVVAAATAPLVVAFLSRGADLTLWLAALMTVAACFVIRMLGENSRMFAEIVRSRFAMAEKQRAAEDAKEAAMAIALTDDLTGLPNRRCFLGELAERITTRAGTARPFAVGLIDLDGFKPINDNHGHPAGDDILRQVAGRLAEALAGRGSAARMGGDEFAILCDGIGAHEEAIALGEEIQAIFTAPFAVDGRDIALTGACGFALFPASAAEPDELVRMADAALYRAKAIGRGGVAVFAAAENDAAARAALEDVLRRAAAEPKAVEAIVADSIEPRAAGRLEAPRRSGGGQSTSFDPLSPRSIRRPFASRRREPPLGLFCRLRLPSQALTYRKAHRPRRAIMQGRSWRNEMFTSSLLLVLICAAPVAFIVANASQPRPRRAAVLGRPRSGGFQRTRS